MPIWVRFLPSVAVRLELVDQDEHIFQWDVVITAAEGEAEGGEKELLIYGHVCCWLPSKNDLRVVHLLINPLINCCFSAAYLFLLLLSAFTFEEPGFILSGFHKNKYNKKSRNVN